MVCAPAGLPEGMWHTAILGSLRGVIDETINLVFEVGEGNIWTA